MLIRLLFLAALLAYAAAWGVQLRGFRRGSEGLPGGFFLLLGLAVVLHAAGLALVWWAYRAPPLVGFGAASASLAFACAAGFLVAGRVAGVWSAGLLVLPPILVLLAVATSTGAVPLEPATTFRGVWFVVHVTAVLAGYASLLMGSSAAMMYLLQFRALKGKRFGRVFRYFPSLETLDRLQGTAVAAGHAVLTLGLIVGWSFTLTFGRGLALDDPAVFFGMLTWVVYGAALVVRRLPDGRGPRSAGVTALAFAVCTMAFLGIRLGSPSNRFFL